MHCSQIVSYRINGISYVENISGFETEAELKYVIKIDFVGLKVIKQGFYKRSKQLS